MNVKLLSRKNVNLFFLYVVNGNIFFMFVNNKVNGNNKYLYYSRCISLNLEAVAVEVIQSDKEEKDS